MKTITRKQLTVIQEHTAQEFQQKFNQAMTMLADKEPEVMFNEALGFCAYITYNEQDTVIESAEDEFATRGIKFFCVDCPYLQEDADKRIKRHFCPITQSRHSMNDSACGQFYELVQEGTVTPLTPDERSKNIRMLEHKKAEQKEKHISARDRTGSVEKPVVKFGSKLKPTGTEQARIERCKEYKKKWLEEHSVTTEQEESPSAVQKFRDYYSKKNNK